MLTNEQINKGVEVKKIRMFLVFIVGCLLISSEVWYQQSVKALQYSLNFALEDDELIILTPGTDFLASPGTVIFLPRKLGMERMIKLARTGEPELSMLFIPRWEAWITDTVVREIYENRIDIKYALAALASEIDTELWHTHNDIGEELTDERERQKRSLRWTMPSSADLNQIYEFARIIPDAKFSGVIAHIYGTTTYWNDSPSWTQPTYVSYAIKEEAKRINWEAGELHVSQLQEFAQKHDGFMKLWFEPAPKFTGVFSPEGAR